MKSDTMLKSDMKFCHNFRIFEF